MNKEQQLKVRREILQALREELKRVWLPQVQSVIQDLIEVHTQAINLIEKNMYSGKISIDIESKINGLTHIREQFIFPEKFGEALVLIRLTLMGYRDEED